MQGEVWCPGCLELDKPQPSVGTLETQRTLYDSIALALATWPLMMAYLGLLASPVVIYIVIRYWKRPTSLIPRSKWRFVLALTIAVIEMAMLALLVAAGIVVGLSGRKA